MSNAWIIDGALSSARKDYIAGWASETMLNWFDGQICGAKFASLCSPDRKEIEIQAVGACNEIRFLIRKVKGIA